MLKCQEYLDSKLLIKGITEGRLGCKKIRDATGRPFAIHPSTCIECQKDELYIEQKILNHMKGLVKFYGDNIPKTQVMGMPEKISLRNYVEWARNNIGTKSAQEILLSAATSGRCEQSDLIIIANDLDIN